MKETKIKKCKDFLNPNLTCTYVSCFFFFSCIPRYVFGVTHVPRLEDWPVMPVDRIGFMLLVLNCSLSFKIVDILNRISLS